VIYFIGILVTFWAILLYYKPQNLSLKDNTSKSILERAKEAKGTIAFGSLIIFIAIISFNKVTLKVNDEFASIFGLSKIGVFEYKFFFQIITSNLFHFDLIHLCMNVSALILLVAYERRIGANRFLTIFAISAVASSFLELFLIRQNYLSLGASAGIAGLACGYFIDYGKLSLKEWLTGIVFSLFIIGLISIYDKVSISNLGYEVNWISHLIGVIVALIRKNEYYKKKATGNTTTNTRMAKCLKKQHIAMRGNVG
jgi:membrane associated rhomboid family serine protease